MLLVCGILPVATWLSYPLVESHPLKPVDAIVILGAGIEDDETPSAGTLRRLLHGLRLFRQGYAPVVILTGGNPIEPEMPESEVMARVATSQFGIPLPALVIERDAATTATQARATAEIARARGIHSIMLVTSAIHSYRAHRAFRKAGLDVVSAPALPKRVERKRKGPVIPITVKPYEVLVRIGALGGVLYEYGAVGLYWWRGWI